MSEYEISRFPTERDRLRVAEQYNKAVHLDQAVCILEHILFVLTEQPDEHGVFGRVILNDLIDVPVAEMPEKLHKIIEAVSDSADFAHGVARAGEESIARSTPTDQEN